MATASGGGGGGQASNVHYKMSKKIAQLTKVIYHLNTKNDDHDWEMRHLTDQYETEIEEILKDASSKIRWFRDQLEGKNSDERLRTALEQLTKQHQQEKEEALKGFDQFKKQTKANEVKIQQVSEEKVQKMTQEVAHMKTEFQRRIQDFQQSEREMEDRLKQQADAQGSAKSQEVEELVKTYNEKYKAMLAQQMEEREELKRELEEENKRALEKCRSDEEKKRNSLLMQLEREKDKMRALTEQNLNEQQQAAGQLQVKLDNALAEAERLKQSEVVLNERIALQITQLNDREEKIKLLEAQMGGLRQSVEDANTREGLAQQHLRSLEEDLANERKSRADAEAGATASASDLQRMLDAERSKLQAEQTTRVSVEAEVNRLKGVISDVESQLRDSQQEVSKLIGQTKDLQSKLMASHDATSESAKSTEELRERMRQQLEEMNQAHNAALKKEADDWQQKLTALEGEHRQQVEGLQQKHDALMKQQEKELKDKWDAEQYRMENNHTADLKHRDDRIEVLQGELQGLQAQLASVVQNSDKGTEKLQSTIQQLQKEREDLLQQHAATVAQLKADATAETTRLEDSIAALRNDNSALQETLTVLKQQLQDTQNQGQHLRQDQDEMQRKMEALRAEHAKQLSDMEEKHQAALASLQSDMGEQGQQKLSHELEDLERRLRLANDESRKALIAEMDEAAKKARQLLETALQSQVDTVRRRLTEVERDLAQQMELNAKLRDDITASVSSGQQELQEAAKQQEEAAARSKAEFEMRMKGLEAALQQQHQAELATLKEQHAEALRNGEAAQASAIQDEQRRAAEEQQRQLDKLRKEMTEKMVHAEAQRDKEWQGKLQTKEDNLRKEMLEKEKRMEKEMNQLNAERHNLHQLNKKLETTLAEDRNTIQEQERRLREAAELTTSMERKHAAAQLDWNDKLRQREADLQSEHNTNINNLLAENRQAMAEMQAEFDRIQQLSQESAQELEERIREWEERFAARPSRDEDLRHIATLQQELLEKDNHIQGLYHQVKTYKLELENREENYNKMFGRSPVVDMGGLQPKAMTMGMGMGMGLNPIAAATAKAAPGGVAPPRGRPAAHRPAADPTTGRVVPGHRRRSVLGNGP